MSIVENLNYHRLFAFFFLLSLAASSNADWQAEVTQQLCAQWQRISTQTQDCDISFPSLSSQYQLPDCADHWQLSVLRPLQAGRNGIEIQCSQPYWKQNVAIQLHSYKQVAVLARPVEIGQRLSAEDVSFIRHDAGTLSKNSLIHPEQVVGREIKRSLKAGTVLNSDMLDAPLLIKRGEQVSIILIRPSLKIEMAGTALSAGRLDERIPVRNNSSQITVNARVIATGIVQVE